MGLRRKTEVSNNLSLKSEKAQTSYQGPKHYSDGDIELDAIERLKSNIMMLDDLQERLRFMNDEIESVLGTKKKS